MTTRNARLGAVTAAAALVLALAGADDSAKPVKADELTFNVPGTWKSETPKTKSRISQFKVEPAEGDSMPAEFYLTVLNGGGGGVKPNVVRWETQFVDADGQSVKAKVEEKKGKNIDVTRVEIAGRYVAAIMPGLPEKHNKPGYRLLGAIVMTPTKGYFFRLTGSEKTIESARAGFDAMLSSIVKSDD
jgi:hypothetical protein